MKKMLAMLLLLPPALITVWFFYRALLVPENHIGFDPYLFMSAAGFSLASASLSRDGARVFALALSMMTVAVIAWAVHFELILQYEDWIRLGMPEKPGWAEIVPAKR